MIKTYLIVFLLTLNASLNLCKEFPPNMIAMLIINGKYSEAVTELIKSTEMQTAGVVEGLREEVMTSSKVSDQIFGLLRYILFHSEQNHDLDLTLQRILTTTFKFLYSHMELNSYMMIQLCEYAKLTNQVYTKSISYLDLFEHLCDNKFPSEIKLMVWGTEFKCIKNKKYDEYLYQTRGILHTGDFVRKTFENDQLWKFQYDFGSGTYRIFNLLHKSYIEKIRVSPDGDVVAGIYYLVQRGHNIISWKIQLFNENEFFIINSSSGDRMYAGPDYHYNIDNDKMRQVRLSTKPQIADVWYLVPCEKFKT